MEKENRIYVNSDYMEGAHPRIIERLVETNLLKTPGYGTDAICAEAREKIRKACGCPDAAVHFLVGGTQTNTTVIDALLGTCQGVIAATTGHVSVHEAGAIEATGHKVLTIPAEKGKISAETLDKYIEDFYRDGNWDHMVQPGMAYISQPTEYGTLYSRKELESISSVCHKHKIPLYVDGARLAYALACKENDVTIPDLAKYCDAFYIGGTKCGMLFGEGVVFPDPKTAPHFFTLTKQHGGLFAKGRLLGIQFDTLFTDDLYLHVGDPAIKAADRIRAFLDANGFTQFFATPTNQIFIVLENSLYKELSKTIEFGFWEIKDENHTVVRIATSWATTDDDVNRLLEALQKGLQK